MQIHIQQDFKYQSSAASRKYNKVAVQLGLSDCKFDTITERTICQFPVYRVLVVGKILKNAG